ncbi:hypothetical protein NDN08_001835 [Rhodosorus marinus]|uniref:Multiple inositol polyphosphate phosphatase 1 n=1 Tax=Rhodosorus marinus TaxID=101924 RepID=A0AAV8US26_9RHOD|nr:hypothetical protein NDN08_001835 [Rhodosorus marinus]
MGREDSPRNGLISDPSQGFGDETLHLNIGDGFSSDEDDTEMMHRYGRVQSPRHHPHSIWPVMFSMVAVVVVLGAVVVLSDILESDTSQIDRACLDGFTVADHLGTDSPYPEPSETKWIRNECKLIHVSMIARGGLKNPTETVIQDLDQLENWIHANIESEAEEVQWLKTWKNKYNESDAGLLSIVGERSFRDIGRRMREIYARHLKVTQGDPILVRSTQDQRTSASAEAFLFGFFGIPWKNFTTVDNVSKGNDSVLKYTDRCHVFTELNSEVSSANSHQEELHLEKVARKVSKDLDAASTMKVEDINAVIDGCILEVAELGRSDRFCSLIAPEDWLFREALMEDGNVYSRAHEFYPFLPRPLWEDLLVSLQSCVNGGEDCQKLDMRFGTESALVPFLLSMDLPGKDCLGTISALAPVSANVAFELYDDCKPERDSGEQQNEAMSQYILRIRLNERYVEKVPICGDKAYCTMDEFEEFIRSTFNSEDEWEQQCEDVATTRRPL